MGYQESYVTINGNIEELIPIIKSLGKSHFEFTMAEPVYIITLQKDVKGKLKFKKGDKFIYFVGERSSQRNVTAMFSKLPDELSNNINIMFTEYLPSDRIFDEEGFALVDDFVWD